MAVTIEPFMLVVVALIVLGAVGYAVYRAQARGENRMIEHVQEHIQFGQSAAEVVPSPDLALTAEVRRLLAAGKKMHAIKLYRERTGVGLKAAKDAVEGLERGGVAFLSSPEQAAPGWQPFAASSDEQLRAEVQHLLAAGQKIHAIKLYRERTGAGLKEAKDVVEAWERL